MVLLLVAGYLSGVASPVGFEPTTSGLGGPRAIHTALRAHAKHGLWFLLLRVAPGRVNVIIVFVVMCVWAGVPEAGQRGET